MIVIMSDFLAVDKSTESRIISKVTRAIASLRQAYISKPETSREIEEVKNDFFKLLDFPKLYSR